ncbi:MAG: 50S ribosomal protein L28 [Gemmatimonadota bacterium]|jgi:large subunit ribosomal protein L28|nr:50S ribosomal protein L28 [Gemmatimonadota bacterium]MDP6528417.1 50S ribosomal protein L28 [Gemmatimonadota bacterium]MDP6803466.1 50S ribosomal protein L28 [Gemmatimonadota bacterium]MDP7032588.1 50S ribosomal protein L28 [Gemmatimonadota bacterium]
MSRYCQVTGIKPISGNNVSHAHNKTRRRWKPNLSYKRYFFAEENRWIRLKISARGIRLIDKKGLATVIREMRSRGEKV